MRQCLNTCSRLPEYRKALLDHLKTVCLRHWDADIRELASQSVRAMATSAPDDLAELIDGFVAYFDELASSAGAGEHIDTRTLHGYLLTLAELASLVKELGRSGLLPRVRCPPVPSRSLLTSKTDPCDSVGDSRLDAESVQFRPRPSGRLHNRRVRLLRAVDVLGAFRTHCRLRDEAAERRVARGHAPSAADGDVDRRRSFYARGVRPSLVLP